jgi:hypothetical protein
MVRERAWPGLQRIEVTMKGFRDLALAIASLAFLSACSVGMAISGSQNPDLGAVKVGASRGEVELQLGSPVRSASLDDGARADIYEYEIGNEPSAGRAVGHGVMDVLTLGLWEIVGTPIEGFQGEKHQATITYDQNDRVVNIKTQKGTS